MCELGKRPRPSSTKHACRPQLTSDRPLLPGTCHSTELVLLPLSAGPLQLEVVRLVDLNSNETVDIRTLPDIMAVDRRKVDAN